MTGSYKLPVIIITKANKLALEELIEDYYKVDYISGFADFYFSFDHRYDFIPTFAFDKIQIHQSTT